MTKKIKDARDELDKLINFWLAQTDFVGGRKIRVYFSKKSIVKFARPLDELGREYAYRSFILVRSDPV